MKDETLFIEFATLPDTYFGSSEKHYSTIISPTIDSFIVSIALFEFEWARCLLWTRCCCHSKILVDLGDLDLVDCDWALALASHHRSLARSLSNSVKMKFK